MVEVSFMFGLAVMSQNLRLSLGQIAEHGPDPSDDPDVILRGPAEFFGHEELNALGEIDRHDAPDNPDH
jgi:hypothetical protein